MQHLQADVRQPSRIPRQVPLAGLVLGARWWCELRGGCAVPSAGHGSPRAQPEPTRTAWTAQSALVCASSAWVDVLGFHLPGCKQVLALQEPGLVLQDLL